MLAIFMAEIVVIDSHGGLHCPGKTANYGQRACQCTGKGKFVRELASPCSVRLEINASDPFYSTGDYINKGLTCLNYNKHVKSRGDCTIKEALPVNERTPYLDLHLLYPNKDVFTEEGYLETKFCGATQNYLNVMATASPHNTCAEGLFAKFHNFCVKYMRNSCISKYSNVAEKCRQVTIAVFQKIIYEELLPVLFDGAMAQCGLDDVTYDCNVNAQGTVEFSAAMGRFPHVWVPEKLHYYNTSLVELPLPQFFGMDRDKIDTDGLIKGMFMQPIQNSLPLSESLHSMFLAGDCPNRRGHSLTTLDFGRNHEAGVCSMMYYVEKAYKAQNVDLPSITTIDDLASINYRTEIINAMKSLYSTVHDIPALFTIFEESAAKINSRFPVTVNHFMCEEMKRMKAGDRLFYSWSLDPRTLQFVKNIKMRDVLAIATKLPVLPEDAFKYESTTKLRSKVKVDLLNNSKNLCKPLIVPNM